ncbi:MAG: CGGC domain-containing protein [Thermodesulfobacteriota bacterium]
MTKVAIIRCEKNQDRCPLTSCLTSMLSAKEGFAEYESCSPAGVFTCRCPGDNAVNLAKILKSKGAEAIHFCTCAFARKTDTGWQNGDGFCDHLDDIMDRVHAETGLPCVKGTAHLPNGYQPEIKAKETL